MPGADAPVTAFHYRHEEVVYGHAPLAGGPVALRAALYLPRAPAPLPPPLFVWFHAGAFKFGSHDQKIGRRLGRRLTREGIAVASVQYRLRAREADLSAPVRDNLAGYQAHRARLIRPGLCEARSLAALEDGLRFLAWAAAEGAGHGWSARRVVAGASAGAITAFNLAFSPPALGLEAPALDGIFATSGGYAYPALVGGHDRLRVLAQHNPRDDRVSVRGVRMVAGLLGERMRLLESDSMLHGHLDLTPEEKPRDTFGRIAGFVHDAVAR